MKKLYVLSHKKLNQIIEQRLKEFSDEAANNYERDLLMKQANIAILQSQINPHFLYNTLECIRGQALLEGANGIAAIANALSRYFRYSISGKSDIVTIEDEIENIKNYTTIQQYRFQERFSLEIIYDPGEDVLNAVLPKLSLQPAVENAILHGFSEITSGGRVTITVRGIKDNISILISDNGKGISTEQLDDISQSLRIEKSNLRDRNGQHTSIGLQNVDKRIKLLFGDEYGLSVSSCIGVGTDVELFIPYRFSVKPS